MACTYTGAKLTQWHLQQQLALRALTLRQLARLWPLWNLDDPNSYGLFIEAALPLVATGNRRSAALAAQYYTMFRALELPQSLQLGWQGIRELPPAPAPAVMRSSLANVTMAGVFNALGAGQNRSQALANGFVRLSGEATRLVLNGERDTILQAVEEDPQALGWMRVSGGDPCAFCAMLLSRGAVYKSEETASFEAHDHCQCGAEPFYEGSKLPRMNRELRELWDRTKIGSTDPLNDFRRALADREEED